MQAPFWICTQVLLLGQSSFQLPLALGEEAMSEWGRDAHVHGVCVKAPHHLRVTQQDRQCAAKEDGRHVFSHALVSLGFLAAHGTLSPASLLLLFHKYTSH